MLKKALILFGLGIITLMIALPFAVFDRSPVVINSEDADTAATDRAKQLVKQILSTLNSDQIDRSITLSHEQVSSLTALVSHVLPMVSARTNKQKDNWLVAVTIKVPKFQSLYINASAYLGKGDIDLSSSLVKIGSFSISPNTLLKLATGFINLNIADEFDIDYTRLVTRVALENKGIVAQIHPEFNLEDFKVNIKSSSKRALQQLALNQNNSIQINHYLSLLDRLAASTANIEGFTISLSDYIAPLFSEVAKRSVKSNLSKENQYALLALIYFSGDSFIRGVVKNTYAPDIIDTSSRSKALLQQRHDLVLHFIYSAAIEIIASAETSIGIGEIKELSDANKGGSGYSFADLMADKAGIRFAKSISNPQTAANMLANLILVKQEEDFFPPVAGLPEGLDEAEFTERFVDTKSHAYRMLEKKIDQRIMALKIYR